MKAKLSEARHHENEFKEQKEKKYKNQTLTEKRKRWGRKPMRTLKSLKKWNNRKLQKG